MQTRWEASNTPREMSLVPRSNAQTALRMAAVTSDIEQQTRPGASLAIEPFITSSGYAIPTPTCTTTTPS